MTQGRLRRARPGDLAGILALEEACFEPYRRASPASLRRSLAQNGDPEAHQSVWVIGHNGRPGLAALLVLWHHPRMVRIYDICTAPDARGMGYGQALMQHAEGLARRAGATRLSLEAEEQDPRLVAWYESLGFTQVARLPDYYHGGCAAVRMVKPLARP